jgi:hypothetical protein
MNLEELKNITRAVTSFDWCGRNVLLRKLSAQDHLDLFGKVTGEQPDNDRTATVEFHVSVVAKALSDEHGKLIADCDEGRTWLRTEVAYDDLTALGEIVLKHSGYGGAEKKTS